MFEREYSEDKNYRKIQDHCHYADSCTYHIQDIIYQTISLWFSQWVEL